MVLKDKKKSFAELERRAVKINDRYKHVRDHVRAMKKELDENIPLEDEHGNETDLKRELASPLLVDLKSLSEVSA